MLTGTKAQLANLLFELGAIQFGAFDPKLHETQPDAPKSPIFINLRDNTNPKPGPLTEEVYRLGAELMFEIIYWYNDGPSAFDHVAGIPNAGERWATSLATIIHELQFREMPVLTLGKAVGDSGRRITGVQPGSYYSERDRVLLIDDLITMADTKLEAVAALEANHLVCNDLVVLIDRQQGGSELLQRRGIGVHAALTLSELLDHYVENGQIDATTACDVRTYIRSNQFV